MIFTLLLGFSALFVASCAAYFSVLGIATLFSGSFLQVAVMASSLELGKLVATSYLYRYWNKTTIWLKIYLAVAVLLLMGITSVGVFGYLSSAYQVNSGKFEQFDNKIELIDNQKTVLDLEIEQLNKRTETLNEIRIAQEKRVEQAGNYKLPREQAYAAIEKANQEIQTISSKLETLREQKFQKDNEVLVLKQEVGKAKDIGTFMFVAKAINKPVDWVVTVFIAILICVFDPLAVCLILAFNVATRGSMVKQESELLLETPVDPVEEDSEENKSVKPIFTGLTATGRVIQK